MAERNDILQRILNLRARAENGATEAEAMTCINRADRLMHSYRVEEAELALAEATGAIKVEIITKVAGSLECGNGSWKRRGNVHSARNCSGAIACYTGTKVVFMNDGRQAEFLGDKPDVEFACFLQDLIRESMDRSYQDWRREQGGATGYGAKKAFQLSMSYRINQRLREMKQANDIEAADVVAAAAKQIGMDPTVLKAQIAEGALPELTSTALVMTVAAAQREEVVNMAFKQKYSKLRTIGGVSGGGRNGTASRAGREAGDRVHLGRSIGRSNSKALA